MHAIHELKSRSLIPDYNSSDDSNKDVVKKKYVDAWVIFIRRKSTQHVFLSAENAWKLVAGHKLAKAQNPENCLK